MSKQYAKRRIIKDITNDDERIQITGYIKNQIDMENILLDDKTGQLMINISEIQDFKFKENDLINVIGDLEFQSNGDKIIQADIVQDMNKLNFEYYQKIYELKKKY